jgi:hypothetical protein
VDVLAGCQLQASSKNASPAAFSFGTSRRFAAEKHDKVPGPGAYD